MQNTDVSQVEMDLIKQVRKSMDMKDPVELCLNYQEIWDCAVVKILQDYDEIPPDLMLTHELMKSMIRNMIMIAHPDIMETDC